MNNFKKKLILCRKTNEISLLSPFRRWWEHRTIFANNSRQDSTALPRSAIRVRERRQREQQQSRAEDLAMQSVVEREVSRARLHPQRTHHAAQQVPHTFARYQSQAARLQEEDNCDDCGRCWCEGRSHWDGD